MYTFVIAGYIVEVYIWGVWKREKWFQQKISIIFFINEPFPRPEEP